MDNNEQNTVSQSNDQSSPTATKKIGLAQKAQLFFRKHQYINGKKMTPVDAEQAARNDLHLPSLTKEETEKVKNASNKNILEKIVDSGPAKSLGLSKVAHEKLSWMFEDKTNVQNSNLEKTSDSNKGSEF